MPRRVTEFQTIRSEGGLLPSDLLRRIIDPAGKVSGVEPTAYGLPAGERINEAITQSWNRLRRHWTEFRAATKDLSAGDAATGLTNDRWSLPLLRELGFGFLATTAGPTIDGKTYAISRFAGATPIHLVGCGVDLDRRAAGVRGAAAGNPHGLVQEFLNRSADHLWAIVANGLSFRILRDNQALSRQSFLGFDLEAMFDGEVYSDFVVLWLVAHASRFLPLHDDRPDSCWLETWSKEAAEQGVAALTDLRGGVEKALEILGQGFVSHPKNAALRDALRKGDVKLSDFHHQLLRVVYRLIFLFVAEDRELEGIPILHPPDKSDAARLARERYAAHYSTHRLRELASRIKGSRHGDLWRQFQLLVGALSGDARFATVRNALALPALGSLLWSPTSTALLNGPGLASSESRMANGSAGETRSHSPLTIHHSPAEGAELSNYDFLEALRHLAFIRKDKILRPVDYKNLGSEEFGGVYESFLALTPQISSDGARFTFAEFAGNERKTSGSYYTPDSLVQCLLDSALDPVVEARLADVERLAKLDWSAVEKEIQSDPAKHTYVLAFLNKHAGVSKTASFEERQRAWNATTPASRRWPLAETALLSLKVCDIACGSGHFLVGAAHRLARHLARVRALAAGESEPSPLLYQTALRDVIGHCLYGVDINPMAVELCKVTLWLEALEPGKPLSFLDHHIRCGNSLLGATPELIAAGLPDEAFDPIEGDDKTACSNLKKLNRAQREGLSHLFIAEDNAIRDRLRQTAAAIDEMGDSRPEDIQRKEAAFRAEQSNYDFQKAWDLANLWCAAFVIPKRFPASASEISNLKSQVVATLDAQPLATQGGLFGGTEELPKAKGKKAKAPRRTDSENAIGITTQHLRNFVENGALPEGLLPEAKRLAAQYQFFHFHLAFPEVSAQGGFDCVLGNPPWERVKIQEKEWFAIRAPQIAEAPNAAARRRLISALTQDQPELYREYQDALRQAKGESHLLRNTGRYPFCGRGDINLYTVFAEGMRTLLNEYGRAGAVLPTGIATDDTTKFFFQDVVEKKSLVSLFDFENRLGLFPDVDSRMKFALFTVGRGLRPSAASAAFVFFAHAVEDLRDPTRRFTLTAAEIALLNPNTRTCPIFRSGRDAELAKAIYRRVPVLIREAQGETPEANPWGIKFSTMFHMSNDSHLFRTREQLEHAGWVLDGNVFRRAEERYLPLYEAKMVHHFDHRWATYDHWDTHDLSLAEKQDPTRVVCGRYWVAQREVGLRSAELPANLLSALRAGDSALIAQEIVHLLFSRRLHQHAGDQVKKAQAALGSLWEEFVQTHPVVRSLTPFQPGPSYWLSLAQSPDKGNPAAPESSSEEIALAAWLRSAQCYPRVTEPETPLTNLSDLLTFAEQTLLRAMPRWLLGWRDIARSTDERTVVGGVFPLAGVGHTLPVWMIEHSHASCLSPLLVSFACDFFTRLKIGGTHLTYFILKQLPVFPPGQLDHLAAWTGQTQEIHTWLLPRILELTYTAWDLEAFAQDCGWSGPPFRWDEERRFLLRCELDAAFFHLYLPATADGDWRPARQAEGCPHEESAEELAALKQYFPTPRDAVAYIMDTFPIVKRKDEARTEQKNAAGEVIQPGRYITKDTILEIYDALAEAMRTGQPYQTRLDPPPADPRCCHPPRR